jgi:alpha-tubulin suppressor-like RCC1 family protein
VTNLKVGTGEYATTLLYNGKLFSIGGGRLAGLGPNGGLGIPPAQLYGTSGVDFIDVAGGLHQSMAIDITGHVWTWGNDTPALQGSGATSGDTVSTPYKILVDNTGAVFDHVTQISATNDFNVAVKDDGSVWVWGNCDRGVSGSGVNSVIITRPTRLPLPSGVRIKKALTSTIILMLATDNTVWAVGGGGNIEDLGTDNSDYTHVHQVVNLPPNIQDISAGRQFAFALTTTGELYGWGTMGANLGISAAYNAWYPVRRAVNLTNELALPLPVRSIVAHEHTTHVILTDGRLYGWGDTAQGELGNGQEYDYSLPTRNYSWDWATNGLFVLKPVQIASDKGPFKELFSNSALTFYAYALAENGKLYSWGRNKTGNLGNGVLPAAPMTGGIASAFPNSWDVTVPTEVNPLGLTRYTQQTSPYCIPPSRWNVSPCDQFNITTGKAFYEQ